MIPLKGLRLTTKPTTPVITLVDAKSFLKVDSSTDDALITLYVEASTVQVENHLHRALITQSWTLTMDSFDSYKQPRDVVLDVLGAGTHQVPVNYGSYCNEIFLARLPIQSITSIKTTDVSGAQTTVDAAVYSLDQLTGRVFLNEGQQWPTNLRAINAIEIIYVAGYGDAATDVPAPIIQAIYAQLGVMYEARGACDLNDAITCTIEGYEVLDYLGFS